MRQLSIQQQQPQYKFYATLLDSFQYYLDSQDNDEAFQEFIDSLNRVKKVGEAAHKGTALNDLIDKLIKGSKLQDFPTDKRGNVIYRSETGDYGFNPKVVTELYNRVAGSEAQVFTKAILPTTKGNIELYGYVDYIDISKATDLKGTSRYTFPKYLGKWQKHVYPYCLNENGIQITEFSYLVTDYYNVFVEDYPYNPEKSVKELQSFCTRLIDFLEMNRHLITDQKVFALL